MSPIYRHSKFRLENFLFLVKNITNSCSSIHDISSPIRLELAESRLAFVFSIYKNQNFLSLPVVNNVYTGTVASIHEHVSIKKRIVKIQAFVVEEDNFEKRR